MQSAPLKSPPGKLFIIPLCKLFTIALLAGLMGTLPCRAQTSREVQVLAAADLFLSADYSFPDSIVAHNLADTPEPIPYARGTLVLWARKDSPLQPLTQNTLEDGHYTSLAIANPEHAPYGRAAVASLTWQKLYEKLKPRLVVAENIAQTAQFVESGNAQLGLISLTTASSSHFQQIGSYVRMPPKSYPEIRQCAVVMKKSTHRDDAHKFLDWLRSTPIQQSLPKYGLDSLL
jgi:molybdate transport system substrate-binding protein